MTFDFTGSTRAEVFAEAERLKAEMIAEAIEAKSQARAAGHVWIPIATCGMPARTVRAAAHRGELAVRRVGRADFIERADLDKWIAERAPRQTSKPLDPTTEDLLRSGKIRMIGGRR